MSAILITNTLCASSLHYNGQIQGPHAIACKAIHTADSESSAQKLNQHCRNHINSTSCTQGRLPYKLHCNLWQLLLHAGAACRGRRDIWLWMNTVSVGLSGTAPAGVPGCNTVLCVFTCPAEPPTVLCRLLCCSSRAAPLQCGAPASCWVQQGRQVVGQQPPGPKASASPTTWAQPHKTVLRGRHTNFTKVRLGRRFLFVSVAARGESQPHKCLQTHVYKDCSVRYFKRYVFHLVCCSSHGPTLQQLSSEGVHTSALLLLHILLAPYVCLLHRHPEQRDPVQLTLLPMLSSRVVLRVQQNGAASMQQ